MAVTEENTEMELVPEAVNVEDIAEQVDELSREFNDIEEIESEDTTKAISLYQKLLKSERVDDNASKIKEQCLYKYVI